MISKSILKEAQDLIAMSKALSTKWVVETVSITEHERIEHEQELDNDPNNYKIVIYTS
jgi:hypothetical protein